LAVLFGFEHILKYFSLQLFTLVNTLSGCKQNN